MVPNTRLEHWLDLWEDLRAAGQVVSLEDFIRKHCQDAPVEQINQFRNKVDALHSMCAELRAMGVRDDSTRENGDNDTGGSIAGLMNPASGIEVVKGFRLEQLLGRGGFGEVWKANGPGNFPLALKLVRLTGSIGQSERRVLESIKSLRHPHLISLFGCWDIPGFLVVAMELADETLLDLLKKARARGQPGVSPEILFRHMAEVAEALDFLHSPHMIPGSRRPMRFQHRDIKPQNLLLVGGCVKVADFGLVRVLQDTHTAHTGRMTPQYAAPEFFNRQTSINSDQYSLAVTYCELRGGRLPFTGNSAQVMWGHLEGEPDLSMLPGNEQAAVRRALAKKPADRWPTCGDFVLALNRQATGRGKPHTAPPVRRLPPPLRKEPIPIKRATVPPLPDHSSRDPIPPPGQSRRRFLIKLTAFIGIPVFAATLLVLGRRKGLSPDGGQRGFADTILTYKDRSYGQARWEQIQDARSLEAMSPPGIESEGAVRLRGVAGWDNDNYFITGYRSIKEGVVYHHANGRWSFAGSCKSDQPMRSKQWMLDWNTMMFAAGLGIFEVSTRGVVTQVKTEDRWHIYADAVHFCPIEPGVTLIFSP